MICNNTSKGVLNTLQLVLIETGQTSEQRVTIVQTTTNQGICSNDLDYEFSDIEGDLGILESCVDNCVNVTNCDDFDKLLLKKRVDQKLVQQARSCSEYATCKEQMGNVFGVIPLSPLMLCKVQKLIMLVYLTFLLCTGL